jgi:hypothetical protein
LSDDRIRDFYAGMAPDDRGRYLDDILAMSDAELEALHDYIQWVFPLPESSLANPSAPVLSDRTIAAFAADASLRERLHRSFQRMLVFYGFALNSAQTIERGPQFEQRQQIWLRPNNHNHLRLTRMIRSLRILGLDADAQALFRALERIYFALPHAITATSFRYWQQAASA